MSRPRPVIPGSCLLITRRCSERRFFLKPSPTTNTCFWYVLAWAAKKHNIGVVAACAMSNHYHLVIIDRDGCYPRFLSDFHGILARCLNAHNGHWEGFWDRSQTSVVTLTDAHSQLEKSNYVLTNPVKDHSGWQRHGMARRQLFEYNRDRRELTVKRPDKFFRSGDNTPPRMPDSVSLSFLSPPEWKDDDFRTAVVEQVAKTEKDTEAARLRDKKRLLAAPLYAGSTGPTLHGRKPSAVNSARVAGRDKWRRIEAIMRNKLFLEAYRAAYDLYRAGKKAVFPAGTHGSSPRRLPSSSNPANRYTRHQRSHTDQRAPLSAVHHYTY